MDHSKMYFLRKMEICHCHVSLPDDNDWLDHYHSTIDKEDEGATSVEIYSGPKHP